MELSPHHIAIRLKPAAVERLKQLTAADPAASDALLTLLSWAHQVTIPVSDIVTIAKEIVPVRPGEPEQIRLVIKCDYHGGQRIYELPLTPADGQRLYTELQKLRHSRF